MNMSTENMYINNDKAKSLLRGQKLMLRRSLEETELLYISERTAENIRSLLSYKNADVVYFYMAVGNEINVTPLFEECLYEGRKCVFPRVINDCEMDFFVVSDMEHLKEGYKGIREPDEKCPVYKAGNEKSIMLVPGTVFDRYGGRIGMGKGFYDRYICNNRTDCLVGVCGEFQLVDKVPMDKNDIYMDIVVTEKGIYKRKECKNGRL